MDNNGLRTPAGFRRLERAAVYVNDATGQITVTADPGDAWPDEDENCPEHDCDASGCGWEHVVARGHLESFGPRGVAQRMTLEQP